MIRPFQSSSLKPLFVADQERRSALLNEAKGLPSVLADSSSAASAAMLGAGYFTPLDGFMNKANALSIAKRMHTAEGLFWPVPVLNRTAVEPKVNAGDRIALRDSEVAGHPPIAIQTVDRIERLSDDDCCFIAEQVFGTLDRNHPGVQTFLEQGSFVIS